MLAPKADNHQGDAQPPTTIRADAASKIIVRNRFTVRLRNAAQLRASQPRDLEGSTTHLATVDIQNFEAPDRLVSDSLDQGIRPRLAQAFRPISMSQPYRAEEREEREGPRYLRRPRAPNTPQGD